MIPARAGSKRLPRKNLAPLQGRPLLAYTVRAALEAAAGPVTVVTEDSGIAECAAAHGAEVAVVPAELTGDLVPSWRPCAHAMEQAGASAEDVLVCLQPSSPLRSGGDVRAALDRFQETGAEFLVSTTVVDPHYFHWALQREDDAWGMVFGERYMVERPLLPPVYRPNGAIKIGRLASLARTGHFFGEPLETFEMPEERSVHVATAVDLALCRALLEEP